MTNLLFTDSFDRPASYWLRRAEQHRQRGDLLRAAVLERHAARSDPQSSAALTRYAQTLRELHCYEASNREAFAALARRPDQTALYGLVAQNLLEMGREDECLDAASLYSNAVYAPEELPSWNDDVLDLQSSLWTEPPPRRKARLQGLLTMAARQIAAGDTVQARRRLRRASQRPFQAPCTRRDELYALLWEEEGKPLPAMAYMNKALEQDPEDVRLKCSAACLFDRLGQREQAKGLLVSAALKAENPSQELTVCLSSDLTGMPYVAYAMLRCALRRRADRYPVCHDLCVCCLRMGFLNEASHYIRLCRDIDPEDVSGIWLFQLVTTLKAQQAGREQVMQASQGAAYYGALCAPALEMALLPVMDLFARGPQALADALTSQPQIRRYFLYALQSPMEGPADLLSPVCACLPPAEAEHLLREILMQSDRELPAKGTAMSLLCDMGAQPPYVVRQEGRIFQADPSQPPPDNPSFRQVYLMRKVRQASRICPDPGFAPWALQALHRMTRAQRTRIIADPGRVWALALAMRYQALHGLGPVEIDLYALNPTRLAELNRALRLLRRVEGEP